MSVVVIGFERSFYIVYEGLETEVCVAVLDRELTNDEERVFTVATLQLTDTRYTASRNVHCRVENNKFINVVTRKVVLYCH